VISAAAFYEQPFTAQCSPQHFPSSQQPSWALEVSYKLYITGAIMIILKISQGNARVDFSSFKVGADPW
jgi:hypothetical protein